MTNVIIQGERMTVPRTATTARPDMRKRLLLAAADLVRRQGVSGTGMRAIVEHADAPRGSLQHYFPGGKEQLIGEAIELSARHVVRRLEHYLQSSPDATPGDLFTVMVHTWRDRYQADGFAEGCPFAATASDMAAVSETLRDATRRALASWQAVLERGLLRAGVPTDRTASLAVLMMSAFEGALLLARTQRSITPLDTVVQELRPVLDGLSPSTSSRGGVHASTSSD
jgi:AcrR family transcriptional regulator